MNSFESYFITSPFLYAQNSIELFEKNLKKIFDTYSIQKACFRDNSDNIPIELLKIFATYCQKYKVESFLNLKDAICSFELAKSCNIQGVHIKSNQLEVSKNMLQKNIRTFYSAHFSDEIVRALDFGVDFVTISPVFASPNKGKPLGIDYIQSLPLNLKNQTFALGGIITLSQIEEIKSSGVRGFASIRYFHPCCEENK